MQYELLQQEFWTTETQQVLRTKIEETPNGRTAHCGPAMATVFCGLARGNRVEGPARTTRLFTFHTEPEPSHPNITLAYQNIVTDPGHRNTSQEVCRPVIIRGLLLN